MDLVARAVTLGRRLRCRRLAGGMRRERGKRGFSSRRDTVRRARSSESQLALALRRGDATDALATAEVALHDDRRHLTHHGSLEDVLRHGRSLGSDFYASSLNLHPSMTSLASLLIQVSMDGSPSLDGCGLKLACLHDQASTSNDVDLDDSITTSTSRLMHRGGVDVSASTADLRRAARAAAARRRAHQGDRLEGAAPTAQALPATEREGQASSEGRHGGGSRAARVHLGHRRAGRNADGVVLNEHPNRLVRSSQRSRGRRKGEPSIFLCGKASAW